MGRLHRILRITNRHPEFYQLLGPFLARREIATELGGPIWDEDNKEWFLVVGPETIPASKKDTGEAVLGFAAIRHEKTSDVFCSVYVRPMQRGQGIFTTLTDAMLAAVPTSTRIVVTANTHSAKLYRTRGFVESHTKSEKFIQMYRAATVGAETGLITKQEQEVSNVG